jgi:hypothetical protein
MYSIIPNTGAGDFTFSRASTAMRRNASGVWESVANNVPRLSYPIIGCPSWLFEPQRTNLFLNSAAPVTQNITVVSGQQYTITVFGIGIATLSGAATGTVTGTNSDGTRLTVTTSGTTLTVTMSGVSGAQTIVNVELGATGTSPIITSGSTLTRLADAPTLTGASALIGQAEGVIYWEGSCDGQTDILGINRSTTNGLYIVKSAGSLYRGVIYAGGFGITLVDVGIKNGLTKIALAFKSGDSALFVNGVKIASNTSAFTFSGALSLVELNGNYLIGTQPQLNSGVIFKQTRISDAELIALTTL